MEIQPRPGGDNDLDAGDGGGEHEQSGAGLASPLEIQNAAQGSKGDYEDDQDYLFVFFKKRKMKLSPCSCST